MDRHTTPEARRVLVEGLRRMTPSQKLARVRSLNRSVPQMARAGIRMRHPNAGEAEIRIRLARLWLDDATLEAIVGPLPEGH